MSEPRRGSLQAKLLILVLSIFILLPAFSVLGGANFKKSDGIDHDSQHQEQAINNLASLGYFATHQVTNLERGVVRYNPDKVAQGYNLYCSGHAPTAILMDMAGNKIHTWGITIDEIWKGMKLPRMAKSKSTRLKRFRHAHMLSDGSLIANFEYIGLVKIDLNSKVIWSHGGGEHHQFDVHPNGEIYALSHKWEDVSSFGKQILVDYISILSANGKLLKEYSIAEIISNSDPQLTLEGKNDRAFDPIHANSIRLLKGFQQSTDPNNPVVLLSLRSPSALIIIDLHRKQIVWSHRGNSNKTMLHQHDASLVENNRILVFDNSSQDGFSRVVELDPNTQELEWLFDGSPNNRFHSKVMGGTQRLGNGNTLITVSGEGRGLEVTMNGEVVWEFRTPHFKDKQKKSNVYPLTQLSRIEYPIPDTILARGK